MLFQVCEGEFFYDNDFFSSLDDETTKTWNHSTNIDKDDVDYAFVWSEGKSMIEACPEDLVEEYKEVSNKIKSFYKSFKTTKIDISGCSIFHLLPKKLIKKYLNHKNLICKHVFENYEKPSNYDFMVKVHRLCKEISEVPLKINLNAIPCPQAYRRLSKVSRHVKYDAYKAITGRLTTKPLSYPVLNLKKEYRASIEPNNDVFVELDFNASELRVFLALSGKEQPEIDIHDYNAKHVFKDESLSREEIKKKTFSWLYNKKSVDFSLETCYNKNAFEELFLKDSFLETFFKRKIKSSEDNNLNYILQSTSSDLLLNQAIKINKRLKDTSSRVAFLVHDSLVLDMSMKDKSLLKELIHIFSDTALGKFKTNVSIGTNYGNLNRVEL